MILALWGRDKLADSAVEDDGGWSGVTARLQRRVARGG